MLFYLPSNKLINLKHQVNIYLKNMIYACIILIFFVLIIFFVQRPRPTTESATKVQTVQTMQKPSQNGGKPNVASNFRFPMNNCGKATTQTKTHKDMWYSVYVSKDVGIDEAKKYCKDANEIYSVILGTDVIQVASFLDLEESKFFADEMKKYLGDPKLGGILFHIRKHVYDLITVEATDVISFIDNFKQEIARFPEAKRENKKEARRLNDKGLEYYRKQDYSNAIDSFLKGYKEDSADPEITSNLGLAYYMEGNLKDAEKNALLSIRYSHKRVAPWVLLGEILAKNDEEKMAVNCFLIAYNFSDKKDIFLSRSLQKTRPGENREVRDAIEKAIEEIKRYN